MRHKLHSFHQAIHKTEKDYDGVWLSQWQDWFVVIFFFYMIKKFFDLFGNTLTADKIFQYGAILLFYHLVSRFILHRKYYSKTDRHPMYSCSLSALILFVYCVWPRVLPDALVVWAAYAGIYGGFSAIVFSAPNRYSFPHVTHIDHYLGHLLIFFIGLVYLMQYKNIFGPGMLWATSVITLIYLLIAYFFDQKTGGNYGMINYPPYELEFLSKYISVGFYRFLCVILYLAFNALSWYIGNLCIGYW